MLIVFGVISILWKGSCVKRTWVRWMQGESSRKGRESKTAASQACMKSLTATFPPPPHSRTDSRSLTFWGKYSL